MQRSPFDEILEDKVGFGKYQYIAYFFASLTHFSDGCEIVGLSILLPVLKKEWSISDDQQGLLGSILFFGILFGSIFGGYVSDNLGRRTALLYSAIVQFAIGVLSTFVNSTTLFVIFRGLFGLIIGFTLPLAPSLASELTPAQFRGRGIVVLTTFFSAGSLYAVIVAKYCLDALDSGNWRAMLIWCSLPSLVVWVGTYIYVKESPRFLIAKGRIQEGIEILNHMSQVNNERPLTITADERTSLKEWQESLFNEDTKADLKALFNPKHRKMTVLLGVMWFTLNFVFFGMTFILPFILLELDHTSSKSTDGLNGYFYTIAGEIPSTVIGIYIIEKESFGRKGTLLYSGLIATALFAIAYNSSSSLMYLLLSAARMFVKLNISIMYPMTTEFYPTTIRTIGLGLTSGIGRIGSSVMPVVLLGLLKVNPMLPILAFAIVTAINGVAGYMLPYDTRGKQLDLLYETETQADRKSINMVELLMK